MNLRIETRKNSKLFSGPILETENDEPVFTPYIKVACKNNIGE